MRLTKRDQRIRRRSRARALQALYAWDIAPERDLTGVAERLWSDLAVGAEERLLATPLVSAVAAQRGQIDSLLSEVTTNWRLERLGAVERSVLRLGVAELLLASTPPRVVIQEAVRLGERFGSEESARFVNGVLDAIARRLGRI
jgi:N utilization substance protein B